jgi:hypothetical protein
MEKKLGHDLILIANDTLENEKTYYETNVNPDRAANALRLYGIPVKVNDNTLKIWYNGRVVYIVINRGYYKMDYPKDSDLFENSFNNRSKKIKKTLNKMLRTIGASKLNCLLLEPKFSWDIVEIIRTYI